MFKACMGEDSEVQKDKLQQVAATVEWDVHHYFSNIVARHKISSLRDSLTIP